MNPYRLNDSADDRSEYSLSGPPPSVPPKEPLVLDLKEALGLPPSTANTARSASIRAASPPRSHYQEPVSVSVLTSPPPPPPPPPLSPSAWPRQPPLSAPSSAHAPYLVPHAPHLVPHAFPQRTVAMAQSSKAHTQCLQLCSDVAAAGDRVAERLAEYATLAKHLPHGFDALANDLLDMCQVLFLIEAGLNEAARNGQSLPLDMITVLDKKFRTAQADFKVLDQIVGKQLDYERQGAMGRMRRGFGKMFGDNSVERVALALSRSREDLKMSAYMFQWSVGADKVESALGIGYIGLAAALETSDLRRKRAVSVASEERTSYVRHQRSLENTRLADLSSQSPTLLQPPLMQPKGSPFGHESVSGDSAFGGHGHVGHAGHVGQESPNTRYTGSSAGSSYDGRQSHSVSRKTAGGYEESHRSAAAEPSRESSRELDALLADIANLDLDSSKVVHVKSEPYTMPRKRPRTTADADKVNVKHALVSAIRARDHKLIGQLLDRGVSPNTGPELHALNEAVLAQDAESVRLLLLYGADANETDQDGVSPLVAAAEKSFLTGAMALLKYGADPNQSSGPELETPLVVAVVANNLRLGHLLLMYGGSANQSTADGDTLLVGCINKKTPKKLVDLLLDYGADANKKNREGKTALFEAITAGRLDLVGSLLDHGANPNLPGPKHMLWPSTYQPPILKTLLEHGADFKKAPGVMELATSINNIESIRILLKAGVDPNAKKDGVYTPLCSSIRDDRSDIFQLLLSNGADPNCPASEYPAFKCVTHHRVHFLPALVAAGAKLTSPKGILETAVTSNNPEALRWLLDRGLDPDEKSAKGHTPLTSAIRDNRVEFVELLLGRGANPNVRGQDWPVCMAVRNPDILRRVLSVLPEPRAFKGVMEMAVVANQLESVKLLLAAGVSVEDRNGGVFSPLTTAIREYRTDIVSYLIREGGADVNAPGEHLPIVKSLRRLQEDSTEIIDLLLESGADPNKVYRGWNGIMQALENGDAAMLKKMCKKGVNLDVRDELGRSVTEIAISRRWEEAVTILMASPRLQPALE
ncbi:hypothetical protein DCS_00279 [Drechmeria coniospora]|uniref:Uncharacterized protein n=1 Tax=Drechmeria coniospora TaxID=98403 RepID=A0A151GPW5_DRECN|nr:hypothetical protein DCS_00279 [Drechmeria coniospora]KYK59149.1 hypothetical protein DCS_00279 [Drechmeria coniospora]ODA77899.1 hypothetical protein RJ55_06502 [Drechmeria coniospora]